MEETIKTRQLTTIHQEDGTVMLKSMKSLSDSFDKYIDTKHHLDHLTLHDFLHMSIFKHTYPYLMYDFLYYMKGYWNDALGTWD